MPSIVQAAQALQASLEGLDARAYSGDDAASGAEILARTEKVCAAARIALAARAAECGAHRDRGFSNASEWMGRQTGESAGRARDELEFAAALDGLDDDVRDAVDSGEISVQEGAEIARTEAECPGSQAEMLDEAKQRGLRGVKKKGRRKRQEAHHPDDLADKRRHARMLTTWDGDLGMICGRFALEPHIGVPLLKRLDTEIDREQALRACECEH